MSARYLQARRSSQFHQRKGAPVQVRDTPTLLTSYLRTDPETIMQVVLHLPMRLAAER